MFNISCWFGIVFTLSLVHDRFKNVTVKCVCKLYPPLLTSTLIALLTSTPIALLTSTLIALLTSTLIK